MFERKNGELPPLKYKAGDKIMGYYSSVGVQMLVGGTVVRIEQSRSCLRDNQYEVKLEPELRDEDKEREFTWWINEKDVQPFKQDIWDRAVNHWKKYGELNRKAYLEYIRMFRALRGENDYISDARLEKELEEVRKKKG